jgi:predicted membrane-bound mannosyltransferase
MTTNGLPRHLTVHTNILRSELQAAHVLAWIAAVISNIALFGGSRTLSSAGFVLMVIFTIIAYGFACRLDERRAYLNSKTPSLQLALTAKPATYAVLSFFWALQTTIFTVAFASRPEIIRSDYGAYYTSVAIHIWFIATLVLLSLSYTFVRETMRLQRPA